MATKKSSLKQQYNRQLNRIKKGYRDIEIRGGSFSKTVEEIIKPVKNITEATIRRLRGITKESLYRQAKTDTGKSGWSILAQRRQKAGIKGAFERNIRAEYKKTREYIINEEYFKDVPKEYEKYYKQWREDYFEELRVKHEDRLEEERQYPPPTDEEKIDFLDRVYPPPEPEDEDEEDGEFDDTVFVNIQLDNIYSVIDKIEDKQYADLLKANLEDAVLGGMDADEQVDFFTEHGGELMEAIDKEAKYRNAKDGDVRDNFFAANHFQNKALNIIWDGDIPLSYADYRQMGD